MSNVKAVIELTDKYAADLKKIYNEVMEYLEDWKTRMRLQWHLPIPIDPPKQYVLRA